jgi:hypothetical protein
MAVRTVPPSEMMMLAEFCGQPDYLLEPALQSTTWKDQNLPVPPYATDLILAYAGAADVVLV